ncbi:hypothetical protein [Acetobacter indonesiensis]|uniref:hypothetical protein n=1 Tax=Acetobacter indonesiensis TaxID=104101 RepID=UPI0015C4F420|nr:hypothetical protein [Acetobacter indonesiensis]
MDAIFVLLSLTKRKQINAKRKTPAACGGAGDPLQRNDDCVVQSESNAECEIHP